jgi:hypothetical protein
MAKTADTAKMADINDPARKTHEAGSGLPPERRTVAPTPDSTKASGATGSGDDESVTETARRATAERAEAAKDAAAERTSEEAERVRDAASSFDPGTFAHAATDRLADNLSDVAHSIRETDLSHLTNDLTVFARRQPLLFFGGAALLGFAAGRMIKASERADHGSTEPYAYGRGVS